MRPIRYFSSARINRWSALREDAAFIEERLTAKTSRFLPVVNGALGLRRDDEGLGLGWLDQAEGNAAYIAFLGLSSEDEAHFAFGVEDDHATRLSEKHALEFRGLRTVASTLNADDAGLSAYARGVDLWQRNHQFCGACGGKTVVDQGGFRRTCQSCEKQHFPRLDPAVIAAVTYRKQLLLGRQASWPPKFYSVLAGFVEPGESLEEAVRREIEEESGVVVDEITYHASQPWPFPSSIMIGFRARATTPDISVGDELEDAAWFSVADLRDKVRAGEVFLSPSLSISRDLIDDFVFTQTGEDTHSWAAEPRHWRRD